MWDLAWDYSIDPNKLDYGAIIATVDLIDCVRMDYVAGQRVVPAGALARHPWMANHEHTEGPYCFVLANVERVKPVFIRGALDFWDIDDNARRLGLGPIQIERLAVPT